MFYIYTTDYNPEISEHAIVNKNLVKKSKRQINNYFTLAKTIK